MATIFTVTFPALGIVLSIVGGILIVVGLLPVVVEASDRLTDKVKDWGR